MDNKNTILGVRITQDEKEAIRRKAHESYQTISDYIRTLALANE